MSLILPAVQSARQSARRVECMNHLRNLSVAMVGYAEGQKRYPAAGYWAGTPGNRYPSHNWCVDLLPYVDRRDLADRWDHTVSYSDSPNGHLGATAVAVFVCPEDDSTSGSVDYQRANAGPWKINAGRSQPEGQSPFASSNHQGGVNVAFADGSVQLLSEDIHGTVYAALFSPASMALDSTPLRQVIPSSNQF